MALEIIACDQGSPEWFQARLGIPTASMFATVMASGKTAGSRSLTRDKYMRELVGERITGAANEGYNNAHMERGKAMEAEGRDLYAFVHDEPLEQIGFIRNGDKGCSPDSLSGKTGMAEIKTALPHILIETLMADRAPPEHKAQCQGNLWVAEREWIDLIVFWPKMPLFVKRLYRDEAYIADMAKAVSIFNEELAALEAKVRRYSGQPVRAAAA